MFLWKGLLMIQWKSSEFKIGINMAGAISAGAYTAGVLDFLVEALEEWTKAKQDFRTSLQSQASSATATPVPLHDVMIEVFSGASAGGMCAAIASVMVQQPFVHIRTGTEVGTSNTFYESWVNKVDISHLLERRDLSPDRPLISLLDCSIIDDIADYALSPGPTTARPYISSSLTLFLTLTNARGVPYQLYGDPSPTIDEFTNYYGDRLRFETVHSGSATSDPIAKPLPSGSPGAGAWPLLKVAAKATGAFPIFLAPRILSRDVSDYAFPQWEPTCGAATSTVAPALPSNLKTWQTLNVDGGVTNNSPFQLAHDYLAASNPKAEKCHNPRNPVDANCAVITVAPFPSKDIFDPKFDLQKSASVWTMLPRLVSVLLSQSRFQGESLEVLTSGTSFSRFVIAPSDPEKAGESPLQCSLLGAFGGFFERTFRAHDFLLGRRNCQKFLMSHFSLPKDNVVIAAGLREAGTNASAITSQWTIDPPNTVVQPQSKVWIPLIPLCGTARQEVPRPQRGVLSSDSLSRIVDSIIERLKSVVPMLLKDAPAGGLLKSLLAIALSFPFKFVLKARLRTALLDALCPNVEGQKPEDCKA